MDATITAATMSAIIVGPDMDSRLVGGLLLRRAHGRRFDYLFQQALKSPILRRLLWFILFDLCHVLLLWLCHHPTS